MSLTFTDNLAVNFSSSFIIFIMIQSFLNYFINTDFVLHKLTLSCKNSLHYHGIIFSFNMSFKANCKIKLLQHLFPHQGILHRLVPQKHLKLWNLSFCTSLLFTFSKINKIFQFNLSCINCQSRFTNKGLLFVISPSGIFFHVFK